MLPVLQEALEQSLKKLNQMRFLNSENIREIYFKGILPLLLYPIPVW